MTTGRKEKSAAATAALAGNNGFSLISNEKLIQLYSSLVRCRIFEQRVRLLYEQGQLGSEGIAVKGREAAVAGVAADLLPEDAVISSPRDFIVNAIKCASLAGVFGSLFAGAAPHEPAAQFTDLLKTAMSGALAGKTEKNGRIAVVFGCEDSCASAIWHEALMNAGANRLPILFVCHSGLAAGPAIGGTPSSMERTSFDAQEHGFPVIPVDGSDVVAVYRVATEAIAHARKGNGATLIDCVTLASDDLSETDPLLKMEAYLSRKGLFSEELKREVAEDFNKELDAAIEEAGKSAVSH
jgi:TPP-dependent pyruvate/acetoin dehydrogenase alpha subunit